MSEDSNDSSTWRGSRPPAMSVDQAEELDRLCDLFEAAWRRGESPRHEDHLRGDEGPFRAALKAELIAIELEWRRRAGVVSFKGADESLNLPDGTRATVDLRPPERSLFETLNLEVGSVPRVLLRDTDGGPEPPVHRPTGGDDPSTGTRYRIDGEIARGGMGAILKGRDPDLGRDVALKVLREDFRDNVDMVRRFVEEAQIGGQLQHPGIVPIYEMGSFSDHRPFFSMKLVKGDTLAKLLADRKDPGDGLPRFLSIFEAIAQTVAYSHARGVIHRDLKPSNVMVGAFGEVQVMDWGLAKVLPRGGIIDDAAAGKVTKEETVIATARSGSDDSDLSRAGSVMGTPSYMAPEQARGEIDRVDERADVFALGSILCEILTGQPAFVGRHGGEIQRKAAVGDLAEALGRLDNCGADVELIALAKDCLAREAEDRPRTAGAVAERISSHLSGVQERLRRAELESVEERGRRRLTTVVASSLGAVVLSLIVATAVSVGFGLRAERARGAAADREAGEMRAKLDAQAARRDAQRQLIDITAGSGLTAVNEGDHALALLWFARAAGLAGDFPEQEELNRTRFANWLRHVWNPEGMFPVPGFRRGQDRFRAFRFSPDGRYLLTRTTAGGSTVWDNRQGRVVPLPVPGGQHSAASWEPVTGSLAVAGTDGTIRVLAPPSFDPAEEISAEGEVDVLEFSRDGRLLAWGGARGARVWDRDRKAPSTPFLPHGGPVATLAFSASGGLLATSARDGKARVFRSASESADPVFAPVPHVLAEYGISHGGPDRVAPRFADGDRSFLTVGRLDNSTYDLVWRSAETGEVQPHGGPPEGVDYLSSFDVDPGGGLVAVGWAALGRLLDARSRGVVAAIPSEDVGDNKLREDVAFSADGRTVATCGHDMKVKLWSLERGRNLDLKLASAPITLTHQAVRIALAPDGRHMAVALWDGSVCLWRAPEGPPVAYSIAAGGPTWPALSPDRRLLLPRGTSFRGGSLTETRIYDADTGKPAGPPMAPGGIVIDAAFRPDGERVAVAALTARTREERAQRVFKGNGEAGNLQVWDPRTGMRTVGPVPMPAEPRGLAYRPDGRTLAVVCANYRVVLVDADSGEVRHDLDPGVRTRFKDANLWRANGEARFSPDGRHLMTWEMAPTLHVWDPDSGRLLHSLEHTERVEHAAFSPAEPRILATGGRDSVVKVWDVSDGRLLALLPHPRWVQSIGFSPDGAELVAGCDDGVMRAWDWRAGRLKRAMPSHSSGYTVEFTAGRRRVAGQGAHYLQIWDWPTMTPISPEWRLGGEAHWGLALPAGDRRAIVGGFDGDLVGYDLAAITTPLPWPAEDLAAFAEVVAGRRVLGGGNVVPIDSDEWRERWARLRR